MGRSKIKKKMSNHKNQGSRFKKLLDAIGITVVITLLSFNTRDMAAAPFARMLFPPCNILSQQAAVINLRPYLVHKYLRR